jgi:hypothetical protein
MSEVLVVDNDSENNIFFSHSQRSTNGHKSHEINESANAATSKSNFISFLSELRPRPMPCHPNVCVYIFEKLSLR